MKAAIISVGNELVLGQITNTNAPYLARCLAQLNVEAPLQLTVPDDVSQVSGVTAQVFADNDLTFVCGGLGPTSDDITLVSVAKGLGRKLATDKKHWRWIQESFSQRQKKLLPENIRQAQYLAGGVALSNPTGLALGSWYEENGHVVVILPGPPAEFKAMVDQVVMPKLRVRLNSNKQIVSRTLHFLGRPESLLMAEIAKATQKMQAVTITSYVQPDEIQVRLKVEGQEEKQAAQLLDQAQAAILKKEGDYYFGSGDQLSLVQVVVSLLRQQHLRVTAAESLTGGLFQSTICSVPGASNVFDGGYVTYAATAKEQLLKIDPTIINQFGVVSAQTAAAMAERSRQQLGVEIGLGFTGVAGPDALEGHPAGEVWIGLAIAGQPVRTRQLHLDAHAGRQAVRLQTVQYGLQMIYQALVK